MCIIAAKPAGVPAPSRETLMTCWDSNPDGAGIAVSDGASVHILKGFMKWEDFEDALDALSDLTHYGVLYHFRIATHGGVRPGCCHPFPVSSNTDSLRSLDCAAPVAVAHNGVIQGQDTDKTTSDTMAYIRDVLAPLNAVSGGVMGNASAHSVLQHTVNGSRLALLDYSGELNLIGKWEECEGVFYSNSGYMPRLMQSYSTFTRSGAFTTWGDVEDSLGDEWELDDMADCMPFTYCAGCDLCEDCYLDMPQCETESEARYNSSVSWYCDEREAV